MLSSRLRVVWIANRIRPHAIQRRFNFSATAAVVPLQIAERRAVRRAARGERELQANLRARGQGRNKEGERCLPDEARWRGLRAAGQDEDHALPPMPAAPPVRRTNSRSLTSSVLA